MYKKGALSILQIAILVLGVVAISYAIGSEVGVVSAQDSTTGTPSYAMKGLQNIAPEFAKTSAGFSTAGIIQGAYWAYF